MRLDLRVGKAAQLMRDGGIVAYPTESVYGLGCDPLDPAAVARVIRLLEEAMSAKPPIQRTVDRVAAVFVPAVRTLQMRRRRSSGA